MNKKIFFAVSVVFLTVLMVAGFALANSQIYTLAEDACNVLLSDGTTMNLWAGTQIGGNTPTGYTLGETREFITTDGRKVIDTGEVIIPEPEPGEPDGCAGS